MKSWSSGRTATETTGKVWSKDRPTLEEDQVRGRTNISVRPDRIHPSALREVDNVEGGDLSLYSTLMRHTWKAVSSSGDKESSSAWERQGHTGVTPARAYEGPGASPMRDRDMGLFSLEGRWLRGNVNVCKSLSRDGGVKMDSPQQ